MDFLKDVFADKALTYSELEAALKDSKTVKLGNLAGGAYVGKEKFDAEKTRADGLQTQLADANKQIDAFKGMDIDGVKKAAEDWKAKAEAAETKAKADVEAMQFNLAIDSALSAAKAKNTKAVKALLDLGGLKMNNGEVVGLTEQLAKVKEGNDYLFASDDPGVRVVSSTPGGTVPAGSEDKMRAMMGLPQKSTT